MPFWPLAGLCILLVRGHSQAPRTEGEESYPPYCWRKEQDHGRAAVTLQAFSLTSQQGCSTPLLKNPNGWFSPTEVSSELHFIVSIFFFLFYVYEWLSVCLYRHHMCASYLAEEGQRRALDPLEVEWQMVVSGHNLVDTVTADASQQPHHPPFSKNCASIPIFSAREFYALCHIWKACDMFRVPDFHTCIDSFKKIFHALSYSGDRQKDSVGFNSL